MSEVVKWDGFPVLGRDRDAWHLLNYVKSPHPVPMWWNWHAECWLSSPDAKMGTHAGDAQFSGFSYLAGTVTPSDLKEAIAEAVAAERERCAKVCEGKISGTFPDIRNPTDADHRQIAWDAACEELAEAIRSAAL